MGGLACEEAVGRAHDRPFTIDDSKFAFYDSWLEICLPKFHLYSVPLMSLITTNLELSFKRTRPRRHGTMVPNVQCEMRLLESPPDFLWFPVGDEFTQPSLRLLLHACRCESSLLLIFMIGMYLVSRLSRRSVCHPFFSSPLLIPIPIPPDSQFQVSTGAGGTATGRHITSRSRRVRERRSSRGKSI